MTRPVCSAAATVVRASVSPSASGAPAVGAVGALDLTLISYPLYYCLVNGAISAFIHQRRAVLGRPTWAASASG